MSNKKYFGTDGIRGKVGEFPITPDFVLKLGWAVGKAFSGEGRSFVIVGKDTRISGYMFESALEAGLTAAGVGLQLLGPMPTPGIAYLTRTLRAQAGIVISASHNPYYDNGIKFFSMQGIKLPDEKEFDIERYLDMPMTTVDSANLGKAKRVADAAGRYIEYCKSTIPSHLDFRGLNIVLDCANGATYHIAPHVFEEIGAHVIVIGNEPDGLNINDKCGATHLDKLVEKVKQMQADIGIALDGDGDRLVMVDHQGDVVDGDELLYIIANSRKEAGVELGPVVGTLMSNLGLEQALERLGLSFMRAKVGDRYVMELLSKHGGILGGEGSGHLICLDRTTTGDGIIAALQVLTEIQQTGKSLRELKQGMEKYPQALVNVKLQQQTDISAIDSVQKVKKDIERQLGNTGRILLRASGTEPLIRVMVEGTGKAQVTEYANMLADEIKQALAT